VPEDLWFANILHADELGDLFVVVEMEYLGFDPEAYNAPYVNVSGKV
jgi:hypothetical protein